MQHETVNIPFNKTPLIIQSILCLGFVTTGLVWIINPPFGPGTFMGSRILTTIIGSLFVFFFGMASLSFIKKVFNNRPALSIADEGITDNSSGVAAGLIEWKYLSGYKLVSIGRQNFLQLQFSDPDTFVDLQTNRFQQRLMAATVKRYGTPVQIPFKVLKINPAEIGEKLNPYLKETEV